MTAKGAYSTRTRVLDAIKAAPETGLSSAEIARRIYGREFGQERHAVVEAVRLLRQEHGAERICTILRPDEQTGRKRAYYRWMPETP